MSNFGFSVEHLGGDKYLVSIDNNLNVTLDIEVTEKELSDLMKTIEVVLHDKWVEEYGLD